MFVMYKDSYRTAIVNIIQIVYKTIISRPMPIDAMKCIQNFMETSSVCKNLSLWNSCQVTFSFKVDQK